MTIVTQSPGRARASPSPPPEPSPASIAAALPRGSVPAPGQWRWLTGVMADLATQDHWYACRRDRIAEIARVLCRHMNWQTALSRPGHAALGRAAGCSPDTVARAIGWLRARGWLGLVTPGWTPMLRAMALAAPGNRAAVYVCAMPRKSVIAARAMLSRREFADLTGFSGSDKPYSAPAEPQRRAKDGKARPPAALIPSGAQRSERHRGGRDRDGKSGERLNRGEGVSAARAMRDRYPWFARLSVRWLAPLLAPWAERGDTPADILWLIDHDPDGRPHGYTRGIRNPWGWLRHRLAVHLGPDGRPATIPPGGRARAEAARLRAEQAAAAEAARARAAAAAADDSPAKAGAIAAMRAALRMPAG
jgi:hypothetical protein